MDLVKTVLLYMMMLVGTATGASPEVTPIPANALPTPTPYVTQAPTAIPTARPTATPQPTRYSTLYVGDKGSAVRALQNRLNELGYLKATPDGNYGAQTKTAVENFQRANGLKVDGIAGRNTQQVLFESPTVIYANAATRTPTRPPVTATPVAPAQVLVQYVDAGTGALLRQNIAQCYGDTYIYADANMVPASYRLVSNSYVFVSVRNSQASPATVTFRYQSSATSVPNTGVSIPVYYLDASNLIISRETRVMYQSGTIAADTTLIPAGYTLSGSSVVYVTVTGNTASPSPVLFRLNRNQATATPTPVTGVVVPVRYINNRTGQIFNTQNVTMYRTGNVFPQKSMVPDGYTLVGNSYTTVTISNGRANPSVVEFRYQPYQPTATPIVSVTVPVNYVDATTNRTILSTAVGLTASQLVYADLTQVPGYTLTSAASVYVTVRNGQASPGSVTFRVTPTATPTPAITYVSVPVRYLYGTRLVASQSVSVRTGSSTYVYADASVYGSNYVLSGSTSVRVTVSAAGVASPSTVTFYVQPAATPTPTPVPSFNVSVPVRYMYNSRLVASQTVYIRNGTSSYVYADASVYGSGYVLSGSNSVRVTVSTAGVASPSTVTFYVVPAATPTPTPVPNFNVSVPVRYMYNSRLVASQTVYIRNGTSSYVYADASVYGSGYVLSGSNSVRVTVSAAGVASPSVVTFYVVPAATPTPTPIPSFDVSVPVRYMYGNQMIGGYQELCASGTTTTIYADPNVYQNSYTLVGNNWVSVYVDAQGKASPSTVVFNVMPIATDPPVNPDPVVFEVPIQVEYRNGNQLIWSTTMNVLSGRQTVIQADSSVYAGYILNSSDRVTVNVTTDGFASPNPVIFYLSDAAPVTPDPGPAPAPAPANITGNPKQELPKYTTVKFQSNYDVYQGPGTNYYRSSNGKASYGARGAARVYGTDGEWLLIGYESGKGGYRIGYIHNYKFPKNVNASAIPVLSYAMLTATVNQNAPVTDDPVINGNNSAIEKLKKGTQVTFLAWVDSKHNWALIEYTSTKGTVRAFILSKYLNGLN